MGYRFTATVQNLVIANGQTASNALSGLDDITGLLICAPATLTGTITVQVNTTPGGTFATLQSGGADITLAATKAVLIHPGGWAELRVLSSMAEAAERVFTVRKQYGG